jgi:hypothetical protein
MGVEYVRLKKAFTFMLAIILIIACLPTPIQVSAAALAPGYHVRWIDRIANLPNYAKDFYVWLEANAHINGALCDPTKAERFGSEYGYTVAVLTGSVRVDISASSAAVQAAVLEDVGEQAQTVSDYTFEVYGAFDRDHPEVFWLTGQSQCGMSLTYSQNAQSGIVKYEMSVVFYLMTSDFDIRLQEYRSRTALTAAISKRDKDVQRILSNIPAGASVAEQVRYLNRI